QLLREPLGDIGRDAAGILADEIDPLSRHLLAVLAQIELDAVVHLSGRIRKLSRIGENHPDLDHGLRPHRHCTECEGGNGDEQSLSHGLSLRLRAHRSPQPPPARVGSLTSSILSKGTLTSSPPTFSTRLM